MNGWERIRAALAGRRPDRVPVMLHNFLQAAAEAGYTQRAYRESPAAVADSFIRSVEKYGYDGIVVELDTATLAGAAGTPVEFPQDEPALARGGRLSSLAEAALLAPVRLEDYRYVNVWLEAVRRLAEHFGDEVFIRGNCDQDPFSLASALRGAEGWLMDLADPDNEEAARVLLEHCTAVTCRFVELMAQTGAHMVSNGDSTAGPALISPAMYERFALPYEQRVVRQAHRAGLPYALHICGDTTPILEAMTRTGADALELDYKTDVRRVHRLLAERITFIGNLDPSGVLTFGTPETVRARAEELIALYADSPRFILNAGCAIPREAPAANIRAMIAAAANAGADR